MSIRAYALIIGAASIFVAGCGDRRDLFYPAYADAVKAGQVTRGWIPDYLPKTSRNIHLFDQDSASEEWSGFEFLPLDSESLRENLRSVEALPSAVRRVPNPHVSWWPAVLKGDLDVKNIHNERFELYVVEMPADSASMWIDLFAIDWSEGRGFFYGRAD